MVAHVVRPILRQTDERLALVRKQRARGILELRKIAGDSMHEAVGRFLALPRQILEVARLSFGFDQPANGNGGATRLMRQPVPVTRQERDFPANHAEFWPPCPARRRRLDIRESRKPLRKPCDHLARGSAEIDFDLLGGRVVENQQRRKLAPVDNRLGRERDFGKRSLGYSGMAGKGRTGFGAISGMTNPLGEVLAG